MPVEYPCASCGTNVAWLTVSEVRQRTGKARRAIYEWIAQARVHPRRLPNGRWLICARSLEASESLALPRQKLHRK